MFEPLFPGHRETCYTCNAHWGACTCKDPESDDDVGFDWEGFWITDPLVSECTRFFVDPTVHYGQAYAEFVASGPKKRPTI